VVIRITVWIQGLFSGYRHYWGIRKVVILLILIRQKVPWWRYALSVCTVSVLLVPTVIGATTIVTWETGLPTYNFQDSCTSYVGLPTVGTQ